MEVLKKNGLDIDMKDCGEMIFDPEKQGLAQEAVDVPAVLLSLMDIY